ncbi:MAG: flagellar motor switch protein FliM [Planctomycetes bacterium]|nr:flagellar motor switch protein FliM [Planctomycetota bacterium]MBI3833529.1 flagellar motor switch protein FliM [Planctomycetota bacterium]
MADVLDQSEIDALLAAVESGGVETSTEAAVERGVKGDREIQAYDFKRPERVSKEQMRALEGIHESFARNFGASLSGFLRTIVEIRVASAEQLTYSEFINSLPNPTNFNLLIAEPLDGQLCLEISPLIIYPIIDRLLGGSNAELFIPQRPLTVIEQRLVKRITDRALVVLTESWSELVEVNFRITEVESNPHLVQIVAPNEVVVAIGFEIKMGARAGTMSLCLPFNVIEPVMEKLLSQGWLAYQRRVPADDRSEELAKGLGATHVNVVAYLAATTITMNELLTLQPGDLVQLGKPVKDEMILQVEEKNKFAGTLGRHKDSLAIKITRLAEVEERL